MYKLWELDLSEPKPSNAEVLCPMAEMVLLNPWMVRQAHAANREVFVWFGLSEHPLLLKMMLAFGVDGLMVDDTIALAKLLER